MTWRSGDTVLWISLCFLGVGAVYIANLQLRAVQKVTEITKEEKSPELISQHTEDAIKTYTLQELSSGANYDMRQAARKIVVERACKPRNFLSMLKSISGDDVELRDEGLMTLKFIIPDAAESVGRHHHLKPTLKALIDCLCNITNNETSVPPGNMTTSEIREESENWALQLLWYFTYNEMQTALRAGLVSRWLANYPFGGPNSSENRRIQIVTDLRRGITEDVEMNRIFIALDNEPEGRRQLRRHGLMGSAIGETPDDEVNEVGVSMPQSNTSGTGPARGQHRHHGSRVHEESAEEQALRRRRREAMVLSDGGGPLGSDDIIPGRVHDDL